MRSVKVDLGSENMFELSEEVIDYDEFQYHLSRENQAGGHFIDNVVDVYVQRVMRTIFKANRNRLIPKDRSFQLFELTFAVDSSFTFWYIAANRNPVLNHYYKAFRDNMVSLVLEVNTLPEVFTQMRYGDRYGSFRMVWSDYEEEVRNISESVCEEFHPRWTYPRAVLERTALLHNTANRAESANLREFKKYTKMAWDKCRLKYSREFCFKDSETLHKAISERVADYATKSRLPTTDEEMEKQTKARLVELSGYNSTTEG